MEMLRNYHWPGNIRELEHIIERLSIIVDEDTLKPYHISNVLFKTESTDNSTIPRNIYDLNAFKKRIKDTSVQEIEKLFVVNALFRNNWNVSRASKDVSMQRSNFQSLMKKYGIKKPGREASDNLEKTTLI
jgi:transcriptional regulator of acetoin/glycerol metabolism